MRIVNSWLRKLEPAKNTSIWSCPQAGTTSIHHAPPQQKEFSAKTIMDEHKPLVIGVKDWAGDLLPPNFSSRADSRWKDGKYSCLLHFLALDLGFRTDSIRGVCTDTKVGLRFCTSCSENLNFQLAEPKAGFLQALGFHCARVCQFNSLLL